MVAGARQYKMEILCSGEAKKERFKGMSGAKFFSYENIFINIWDVSIKFHFGISLHLFVQDIGTVRCFKRKLLNIKVWKNHNYAFFKVLNNYNRPFLYVGNFFNDKNLVSEINFQHADWI